MVTFGIKTPPQRTTWNEMLDIWRAVDDIDVFASAWNFDHFYPLRVETDGPCLEAWTTLTALAQATSRIRIGAMVNGMHYRHPAITANMAASLDIISGGRLNLGLGAGWYELESEAYGIELGTMKERMDRFDEGVEVIVSLLTQEHTTFNGQFYHLANARCEPKGPQQPHPPIVIGGKGRKRTLRTVARYAQMWDSIATPGEFKELQDVLAEHCQEVGRDVSEITKSSHVMFAPDAEPAALMEEAQHFIDAGADQIVFSMRVPYRLTSVERLAEELRASTG